jgi:hypothetical protein
MGCSDCFGGCVETTSDQCVKYTGNTIEALGITKGDSLSEVTLIITNWLQDLIDGTGITPIIDNGDLCTLVSTFLTGATPTLNDVLSALIQSICDLQEQVDAVVVDIEDINGTFTGVPCLTDVEPYPTGAHDVLQLAVTTICQLLSRVDVLENSLALYVTIAQINTYIAAYLAGLPSANMQYTKMIPYTAILLYGHTENFAVDGSGIGDYEHIYICNGQNGTPILNADQGYNYIMYIP